MDKSPNKISPEVDPSKDEKEETAKMKEVMKEVKAKMKEENNGQSRFNPIRRVWSVWSVSTILGRAEDGEETGEAQA